MAAFNDFIYNIVPHIFNMIGYLVIFNLDLVVSWFRVFPAVTLRLRFRFAQGKVFLGYGFVICEGGEFRGKKFAVFIYSAFLVYIGHVVHMFDYLENQGFILFLGVLLV